MRNFDALKDYPQPKALRIVGPNLRTICHRIIATYRGEEFYDGDRNCGYGGFRYDGRWLPIAKNMGREYNLGNQSAVLQIGCEKGFLLHDFLELWPRMKVRGTDLSSYAIEHAMPPVKPHIQQAPYIDLPFKNGEFDFVVAIGVVYSLNLTDAIRSLKEIQRVGKGKSFITLASYQTEEDLRLFRYWTLLGTTVLTENEWVEVLNHAGYTGDYKFTNAESLNLAAEKQAAAN
ncbi:MAG: class I SAM-dependent methyltransferase [Elusimicrobia bacterium]|nr:class I SAM-dependent methyltransferase [Elusimicrobiota bacterium]